MSGPVPRFVRLSELETATPTETIIQPTLDDGDHDRFAHFARKADIVESAVSGRPIVALCGKVWVPGRNPDRYPVCPILQVKSTSVRRRGRRAPERLIDPPWECSGRCGPSCASVAPSGSRSVRRLRAAANVDDLRRMARRRLPAGVFDYIDGGCRGRGRR